MECYATRDTYKKPISEGRKEVLNNTQVPVGTRVKVTSLATLLRHYAPIGSVGVVRGYHRDHPSQHAVEFDYAYSPSFHDCDGFIISERGQWLEPEAFEVIELPSSLDTKEWKPTYVEPENAGFVVKDSGKRHEFASGMVRDTSEGKTRYHRVYQGPMLKRWAAHLSKGAVKYKDPKPGMANWMLAEGEEELARFKESAATHFAQWMNGETDEDHAAAVYFNINGAEYVKDKIKTKA